MKIIKVLAYAFALTFFGWCFVTGSEAEEAAYEAQLEQQQHELQMSKIAKAKLSDIHEVGENK